MTKEKWLSDSELNLLVEFLGDKGIGMSRKDIRNRFKWGNYVIDRLLGKYMDMGIVEKIEIGTSQFFRKRESIL